jgi:hypothetical protein
MKLYGVLDKSFDNFLCLRGYASMGDLYRVSKADEEYQRGLIPAHQEEIKNFLDEGRFMFFPEVTLGTFLEPDKDGDSDKVGGLFAHLDQDGGYRETFANFKLRYSITTTKGTQESRTLDRFRRATLEIADKEIEEKSFALFDRIDGNHRLSITLDEEKFEKIIIPYCLILFRKESEARKHSRALFHNINYKQIPLTMEQNLKLILDDDTLFDDTLLKTSTSFGYPYYLSRKVLQSWDLAALPLVQGVIDPDGAASEEPKIMKRTFLLQTYKLLLEKKVLPAEEKAINQLKEKLSDINTIYREHSRLQNRQNVGLLTAFVYYSLLDTRKLKSFTTWVVKNHIYAIEQSNAAELIKVFDKVLESRHRTVFISMQFCDDTNPNYEAIKNSVTDVNREHKLDLQIEEIRIDKFTKGHSYKIDEEILQLIEDCGLLVADTTLGNKNVYHEIGYLMGLNQGEGNEQDNFILVHNTDMANSDFDRDVGFNLKAHQILVAKGTDDLRTQLTAQIETYYGLN